MEAIGPSAPSWCLHCGSLSRFPILQGSVQSSAEPRKEHFEEILAVDPGSYKSVVLNILCLLVFRFAPKYWICIATLAFMCQGRSDVVTTGGFLYGNVNFFDLSCKIMFYICLCWIKLSMHTVGRKWNDFYVLHSVSYLYWHWWENLLAFTMTIVLKICDVSRVKMTSNLDYLRYL